jgi:putative flippase GtrA
MSYQEKPVLTKKQNLKQGFKFFLFSCSAGLIQITSFTLLNEFTKAKPWLSYIIALVLSVLYSFTINRKFTFKSAANVPVAMLKVAVYYAIFAPLSTMAERYLTETAGWNEYLVTGLVMLTNLVTEFLVYRLFVYRNSMYTNKSGLQEMEREHSAVECDCGHEHECHAEHSI